MYLNKGSYIDEFNRISGKYLELKNSPYAESEEIQEKCRRTICSLDSLFVSLFQKENEEPLIIDQKYEDVLIELFRHNPLFYYLYDYVNWDESDLSETFEKIAIISDYHLLYYFKSPDYDQENLIKQIDECLKQQSSQIEQEE